MIIGNGLIANKFREFEQQFNDVIIFASGVSDSLSLSEKEFNREYDLLLNTIIKNPKLKLIYFSSVLVENSNKPYYKHKLCLEELIKSKAENYLIYRLPQIVGKNGNKNTLFNYIKNNIVNNELNLIYLDAVRALIDVDDLIQFVIYSKHINNETIIFSYIKKIKVSELCLKISKFLGVKPRVIYNDEKLTENQWTEENSLIVVDWLCDVNTENYNDYLIEKYIQNGNTNWIL